MAIKAALCAVFLAAAAGAPLKAQDYPAGNVTIVVALGAGGSMDVITRLYGEKLSQHFGKPFIVENRGGAAGNIAAETVARARPDGQTLLVASSGVFSINKNYFKTLRFDPDKDFEPLALYVKIPFILVARADAPWKTLPDLVKAAKEAPGRITFASTGVGLAPHLAGELLKMKLGIDLTHVPYKGSMAQAVTDVIAGHVDLVFADPSIAIPLIKSGKLRAYGVTSTERMPQLPDVATIAEELKAPDYEAVSWHVIAAPAKTPKAVVDKLRVALQEAFKDPMIVDRIQSMGLVPVTPPLGPDASKAYIAAETEKWGALLKRLDLVGKQ